MSPTLPYRAALAALAIAAAWRVRPLRPVAAMLAALAGLDAIPSGDAWLLARVARQVTWPGVVLAGAAWGLKGKGPVDVVSIGAGDAVSWAGTRRSIPPPRADGIITTAVLVGYLLLAAIVAALYRPGVGIPAALAARLVAVVVLVAMLARHRPQTWAQLALVIPAVGLAVGVVAGAWPLVQAGRAGWPDLAEMSRLAGNAVRAGWRLARVETGIAMGAEAIAICLAWRAERRTIAR